METESPGYSSSNVQRVEKELDRIFASLGHGMYVVDENRRILLWNRAAQSILGWSEGEALGRDCKDFIGHLNDEGEQLCEAECPLVAAMGESHTVFAGTVLAHSKTGEKVPVNVSCAPLFDDDGRMVGAVEVFSDMTREKQAERLKNDMVSVVSHELRTPLTSMKGYLELIVEGDVGEINEEQREFLKIVESNVDRLQDLVNDLLDIGRLESGRVTLHWEELDLRSILEDVISTYRPMAGEKGLELLTEFEEVESVLGDRQLMNQVVSNLVSNAIKYTGEGSVTMRLRPDDRKILLEVEDTGVGIPADEIDEVLEKFYRASTAAETGSSGSGLGLAITKEVVEKHGGDLLVKSAPKQGSRFSVVLPVAEETSILANVEGDTLER